MAAFFNFEVHTPYRLFFSGKVQIITLTLADGEIGVYANHSPFSAPVVPCMLRVKDDEGKWRGAFVSDGILEVKADKNVLLVNSAEWPEEIDRERAIAAKQHAEESLHSAQLKYERDKLNAGLRRAECRLKIAGTTGS